MAKANTAAVRDKLAQRAQNQQQNPEQNGNGGATSFSAVIKQYLRTPAIKSRFDEVLKNRAPQFMSSIINLCNADPNLQACTPMSIISACMVAATLNLPVDRNLGYAWIVPYRDNKSGQVVATFQLGYRGYIQLALRSGQYRRINAVTIYKGELVSWNPLTEELVYDPRRKESDEVEGYAGYFELLNGFTKTVFWTRDQIEAHRQRFSKTSKIWDSDYEAMALKTVIRSLLGRWGILSVEMQEAYSRDVAAETGEGAPPQNDIIDAEFEVKDSDSSDALHDNDSGPDDGEPANDSESEAGEGTSLGLNLGPEEDPFAD
ncbi:recombinase RecT [Alicyclobacillus macrosporangiidus]|uniref:Recombination protein RecT n=1 Tax=Alicyclobacillus macrosporangiidus TaxID=392015 RepID=A0A1I7FU67_9BACL|nr:recombinase RecT [Alicyclobacillus macrosporangiidus]SFU39546.1 recombination protein RecT [Alicyclobacillus macrosporangiidus]